MKYNFSDTILVTFWYLMLSASKSNISKWSKWSPFWGVNIWSRSNTVFTWLCHKWRPQHLSSTHKMNVQDTHWCKYNNSIWPYRKMYQFHVYGNVNVDVTFPAFPVHAQSVILRIFQEVHGSAVNFSPRVDLLNVKKCVLCHRCT